MSDRERVKVVDSLEAEENLLIDFQMRLHEELTKRGMTRAQLAHASGISTARLSQIFSADANPTLKTCARLFKVLGEAIDFRICSDRGRRRSSDPGWNFDVDADDQIGKSRRGESERAQLVAAVKESIACNDNRAQVLHWGEAVDLEAA